MKISELKHGSAKVMLTAKIISKEEPRQVNTRYGTMNVCNALIEDETGQITLVLWDKEIESVKVDDTVKVENGFVKEWNGSLQLSAGKFGKLTVV